MLNMRTVLGIDLGTQAIKVLFYDPDRKITCARESAALNVYQNDDGAAEQQTGWWTSALCDALRRVPKEVRDSVAAISVSGQQHGFVPIDTYGEALASVKLWCDTSTTIECSEIMETVGGPDACIALAGNHILPGYTASKIRYFKKHSPALYARLATILLPHDYLNFWLTGERVMEMGDASGTGLLDIRNRVWSKEMVAAVDNDRDIRNCLPSLLSANQFIGKLHRNAAEKTGLPINTPVAIGGGDNMMSAIGTGNISSGRVTVSLGTSGTVYAYSDKPVIDKKGEIAAFCSSNGGWLPLLCTMNCTVTTELIRRLLQVDIERFDAQVQRAALGSQGILTLPFFNGERTPNLPKAKGCLLGMDSDNMSQENFLRSGVEGATFALKSGVDSLRSMGVDTQSIVLTGGGSKSPAWRQIIADIFGVDVNVMREEEGAAFGAALQAYCALENIADNQQENVLEEHYQFDDKSFSAVNQTAHSQYSEIYEQYQEAVNAVSALYR